MMNMSSLFMEGNSTLYLKRFHMPDYLPTGKKSINYYHPGAECEAGRIPILTVDNPSAKSCLKTFEKFFILPLSIMLTFRSVIRAEVTTQGIGIEVFHGEKVYKSTDI